MNTKVSEELRRLTRTTTKIPHRLSSHHVPGEPVEYFTIQWLFLMFAVELLCVFLCDRVIRLGYLDHVSCHSPNV